MLRVKLLLSSFAFIFVVSASTQVDAQLFRRGLRGNCGCAPVRTMRSRALFSRPILGTSGCCGQPSNSFVLQSSGCCNAAVMTNGGTMGNSVLNSPGQNMGNTGGQITDLGGSVQETCQQTYQSCLTACNQECPQNLQACKDFCACNLKKCDPTVAANCNTPKPPCLVTPQPNPGPPTGSPTGTGQ